MSVYKWVVAKDTTDTNLSGSSVIHNLTSSNLKLEKLSQFGILYFVFYFFDNLSSVKYAEYFFSPRLFSIVIAERKFKTV